jgi:hypothetical protein
MFFQTEKKMKSEFDEFEELQDDDCPCCRFMREEWGMIEDVPINLLKAKGIPLPDPATLDDSALHNALWTVIHELAELRIFLECTDHLSDGELYAALWSEILHQRMMFAPGDIYGACHVDLSDAGSGEPTNWLRYYADEETRERWQKNFPDTAVPVHEDPPFARAVLLPSPGDVFETLQ